MAKQATQAERDKAQAEWDAKDKELTLRDEARDFNEVSLNRDEVAGAFQDLTYEEALAAIDAQGWEITEANSDTLGDGFPLIDKERLINRPCLLINWEQDSGANRMSKDGFLIIRGITKDGQRFRFSAGGYGLAEELRGLTARRRRLGTPNANAGLALPNGLARSQVEGVDAEGNEYRNWIYRAAL